MSAADRDDVLPDLGHQTNARKVRAARRAARGLALDGDRERAFERIERAICRYTAIHPSLMAEGDRRPEVVRARSVVYLLIAWCLRGSLEEIAAWDGRDRSAVRYAILRTWERQACRSRAQLALDALGFVRGWPSVCPAGIGARSRVHARPIGSEAQCKGQS